MKKSQTDLVITLILGLVTLFLLILSFFALTDIYHGEPDAASEWTVVRTFFVCTVFFLFFSLKTVISRLKQMNKEADPPK
jgi:hypothetical protein